MEAFANNEVSTPLQMKAQCLERKVEKLPQIKKIMEQYFGQGNTCPWSYEEYGKNVYLKSQFRALRTPQQREASKAKRKMMAPHADTTTSTPGTGPSNAQIGRAHV